MLTGTSAVTPVGYDIVTPSFLFLIHSFAGAALDW
jgi:hypothetical protein